MKLGIPGIKISSRKNALDNGFLVIDLTWSSVKVIHFIKEDHKLIAKGVAIGLIDGDSKVDSILLKKTIAECFSQSGMTTKDVILGLSGADTFGFVLLARQTREDKLAKITSLEFDQIYEKIKLAAYSKAKQRWNLLNANFSEFEPLDMVITSVKIDSEEVDNAIGTTGEEILFEAFCSYASSNLYNFATRLISKEKMNILTVTTDLYAISKLISEKENNFITIDIGEHSTDIGVVFGKSLINTKSFDMGGEFFTKELATKMKIDNKKANSLKESYALESLKEDEMDKIGDILFESGKNWVFALETVLASFSGIKSFPNKIYLCGGGAILPVILELIYDKDLFKNVSLTGSVDVKIVDSSMWVHYIKDEHNLLSGSLMFVPSSLSVIYLELKG